MSYSNEEKIVLTASGHIKMDSHEGVTTRLEVYSDAIFSIIATITILPAIEELRDGGSFDEILDFIFLYFVSFQFIVLYYREHNFKYNRLLEFELTDVILNAIFLVILGFFPFINILLYDNSSNATEEGEEYVPPEPSDSTTNQDLVNSITPVFMQVTIVASASIVNFLTTLWIERKSPFERESAYGYVRVVRNPLSLINVTVGALIRLIIYLIGCLTVATLALVFHLAQASLLGYLVCLILLPLSRRFVLYIDRTKHFDGEIVSKRQVKRLRKEGLFFQKERALAFADGLFAIAGTIVAVNLRPPEVESGENLAQAVFEMWPQFLSYILSFLILAFWWYLNWKMFAVMHEKITFVQHWLNLQFLCFVGALPVAAELIGSFNGTDKASEAIQIYCIFVFVIGITQLILWILILNDKHVKVSKRYKYLIFVGILIGPIATIPSYILALIENCQTCLNLALLIFGLIPLVGVLVYVFFSRKVEKKEKSSHNINIQVEDL